MHVRLTCILLCDQLLVLSCCHLLAHPWVRLLASAQARGVQHPHKHVSSLQHAS